jgi:periplasmic divalent cation tolerance protein
MSRLSLVITSVPDRDLAQSLAQRLVAQQLVACAHVGAPIESMYLWEGKLERAQEIQLSLKTTTVLVPEVIEEIKKNHPFDVPEILSIPITDCYEPYAQWVEQSVVRS